MIPWRLEHARSLSFHDYQDPRVHGMVMISGTLLACCLGTAFFFFAFPADWMRMVVCGIVGDWIGSWKLPICSSLLESRKLIPPGWTMDNGQWTMDNGQIEMMK
jgi:hypothetical protein